MKIHYFVFVDKNITFAEMLFVLTKIKVSLFKIITQ